MSPLMFIQQLFRQPLAKPNCSIPRTRIPRFRVPSAASAPPHSELGLSIVLGILAGWALGNAKANLSMVSKLEGVEQDVLDDILLYPRR
jgi:hypothetical protein